MLIFEEWKENSDCEKPALNGDDLFQYHLNYAF